MSISQLMQRLQERLDHPGPSGGNAADEDLLQLLNGLLRHSPSGLSINPLAAEFLNAAQLATLKRVEQGLEHALQQDKAMFASQQTSALGPVLREERGSKAHAVERTSGYVDVKTLWYGFKVFLSHSCVNDVTAAGSGATGILVASGVASWIAPLVAAITGAIAGFDQGSGATVYFVWPATLIWIRSGNQL